MFGAVVQLLLIWEELIAAGSSPATPMGKVAAHRKSCVGSTWCRYGVGTGGPWRWSWRTATRASGRHTRSSLVCRAAPANARGAGQGHRRHCHRKGWNLYICGNGGMKPRHAELFASDSRSKTWSAHDRPVLMFYVHRRPAAAHQHLAREPRRWPGLPRDVLKDSLGLCAELESQMQQVVDTYQCEWKPR